MLNVFRCLVLVFFSISHANDTKVTVASGGIVIEAPEPDIEMVSESLEISIKKIRVVYDFFNHGPNKTIKIGFPLPRSPYDLQDMYPYANWDEAQIALRILYGDFDEPSQTAKSLVKNAEIIDFLVLIDGKNKSFHRHVRALDPLGKDITDLLNQHRIPISSAYLRGFVEQPPMDLFPGLKETLKTLGLLNIQEQPNWQLQTTYVWENTFLSQKHTNVEHTYTPSYGSHWVDFKAFDSKIVKVHRDRPINLDACSYDAVYLEKFLDDWKRTSTSNRAYNTRTIEEVRYILKTGANWRGPIGKFRLEIKPNHPRDMIILAGKYLMKRQDNGVCVVELENFTPQDDLRVWIIPYYSNAQENHSVISSIFQKMITLWPF